MNRFYKALAAVAMALLVTLGAFALSFAAAYEVPADPMGQGVFHEPLKTGPVFTGPYPSNLRIELATADLPSSFKLHSDPQRPGYAKLVAPRVLPPTTAVHKSKVSLQILQSVLIL